MIPNNKQTDRPETRKQVADWLGVSVATVRSWDQRFSSWLESPPGQKGIATKKRYTENDLIVLLAIKNLRNKNKNFSQIDQELESEISRTSLEGWGDAVTENQTTDLVTVNKLTREIISLTSDLSAATARSEAIENERDRLLQEVSEARTEATKATERATAAETELTILKELTEASKGEKLTFWQRIFGKRE